MTLQETLVVDSNLVTRNHTSRLALVYVRQSDPRQVVKHNGSAHWQRSLTQTALALGWSETRVTVFEDLGLSGTFGKTRENYNHMLELVRKRQVGLVLFVDQTRLARNDADWGLLIEVMAATDTLLHCDGETFDLNNPSDRLALGITQSLAIADSQQLIRKTQASKLALARQGKLKLPLPVGYVRLKGAIRIDNTPGVREAIERVFNLFRQLGTVRQVARHHQTQGWTVPRRRRDAPEAANELVWEVPTRDTLVRILQNPTYAGTYAYGKRPSKVAVQADFSTSISRPRQTSAEDWHACLPNAFEGFISWEEFLRNQEQIRSNDFLRGSGVPRSGAALLQGLGWCGQCGCRLNIGYDRHRNPRYICARAVRGQAASCCPSFWSHPADQVVVEAAFEAMGPAQLELAVRAREHVGTQKSLRSTDQAKRLERARRAQDDAYRLLKSALARNLDDALVTELEHDWIEARALYLQEERALLLKQGAAAPDPEPPDMTALNQVCSDLRAVWNDARTRPEDRKALLRCLLESVTVRRDGSLLHVVIRWHTGQASSLTTGAHTRPPTPEQRASGAGR